MSLFPKAGSKIEIQSYKHNGTLHRVWEETLVLQSSKTDMIGFNDRIMVSESDGRQWRTREPAICYFSSEFWFNVICMIREDGIYYYCNLGSPTTFDGNERAIKYIDYDLDIKVFPDMSYTILDEDEYERHRREMNYPKAIDRILKQNVQELINWIRGRKGPFNPTFVDEWYREYEARYRR
ncbi:MULTISPECIES: nucleoside tri-diphosphate phosphatase [Exiguobacterium]|uniref:DUF402 domain-containing protein n=1 Tax=Exiguobacterium alkaliphilum TaxID=1428684 RepID=A0ABT2KZG1_9BACL|nr:MULTISPECIES: DUF402 domain-containing protein [Exiguobacterium]KDN59022.1 hypothetical protein DI14_09600 [Exiguobacterium sp. AB2]MCT4782381.1 DUF402 domain-containing protein [Exiguobacterium himgiriensis]MCT4795800.1 DUF402 domain-containing protein [Exiguobacterium alkaliphilum]QUE86098.1 DUF402 domain-containing protein [Exiguobacterium alkaliphilum]